MTKFSIPVLLIVISLVCLMAVSAQENPTPRASPQTSERLGSSERVAAVGDPGDSPHARSQDVKLIDPTAATKAWLDSVPLDQREKSNSYFEGGYWLILWNFILTAAISIFLLVSRFSARLRNW